MSNVNRPLTHRQRQALATRQFIVAAASDLFLENGYGATTIESISSKAGVAVSTVYAVFKNKRGILTAIRETWHELSGQRAIFRQALEETDPNKRIAIAAHATRRQWETSANMITIYKGAAAVDPDAAAELEEALQGRRVGIQRFIEESASILRHDLSPERATAIFLALTRSEVFREFVDNWGWSMDDYETWLVSVLTQQLLP